MTCGNGQFGVTQKAIADALGLSQATVALALSSGQRHRLLPETVELVTKKAEALGYRPHRVAKILRSGRSHTIGVVFRSGVYHAPQERVKLLARQAIEAGYQLIAADLDWFGMNGRAVEDYLLAASVEGVIFCNIQHGPESNWPDFLKARRLPAIQMSNTIGKSHDLLRADLESAFCEMTRHHLAAGSTRLTLLLPFRDAGFSGPVADSISDRVDGFVKAIRERGGSIHMEPGTGKLLGRRVAKQSRGGTVSGKILYPVRIPHYENVYELGHHRTERMILQDGLPDSLVCNNDEIAAGSLSACLQYGISVPGTVKISGVDDAPFSPYCGVPLTTIRQPSLEMARQAVKRIVELIEHPSERVRKQDIVFPCDIVIRQSTAGFSTRNLKTRTPHENRPK